MQIQLPASVQKVFAEFEQSRLRDQAEHDKAEKKYSSTVFENGMNIRYWTLKLKHRTLLFCYTGKANCTGCYLTWRSVQIGRTIKRSNVKPHDTRREAKAWAYRDYKEHKAEKNLVP